MEDLLDCRNIGRRFSAKIGEIYCEGKIQIEEGRAYLCQNQIYGIRCSDTFGYTYSWMVSKNYSLPDYAITEFKFLDEEIKVDGTPKDKGKEIMSCFGGSALFSKTCVGFIEQALINYGEDTFELQNMDRELNYWNEVKLEIDKL